MLGRNFLQVRGISKDFSGTLALDSVDFELKEGEVHALVGENGAGKSTLIKILSGIHRADQGEIYLHGQQVDIPDPLTAQRLGIAAIYQEPTVFRELSIAENVFMGHQEYSRLTRRIDWGRMYHKTQKLLDSLDVKLGPKVKVKHLSVAEQQLIGIVKAFPSTPNFSLWMNLPLHLPLKKLRSFLKRSGT